MDVSELKKEWLEEEKRPLVGWDFSPLIGRTQQERTRWDYESIIKSALDTNDMLLDMGTGGGEFLLSLGHPHENTSATKSFPPDYKICQERLSPLGIDVRQTSDLELPFDNDSFDIIINKHTEFDTKEVRRVLKDGGLFITQQIGAKNNLTLSQKLIEGFRPQNPHFNLEGNVRRLRYNGFDVLKSDEQFITVKFFDIGAVVIAAKSAESEFPDFSVEGCFEKLVRLQEELVKKGWIESIHDRFIIVAQVNK